MRERESEYMGDVLTPKLEGGITMNRRDLADLIVKIVGLLALLMSIVMLHSTAIILENTAPGRPSVLLLTLVPIALMLGIGLLLIRRSSRFASVLLGKEEVPEAQSGTWSSQDVQDIAFSVMGLYILVTGIPGLLQFGIPMVFGHPHPRWSIVAPFVRCLLGIGLFLQARGIARFWHRLRKAVDGSDYERTS